MAAGSSRWLVWLGAAAALAAMLILSIVLRVQEIESKAWPITRAVVARLATDEGARDLFARNPRLSASYPTAEAFVAAVAAQRAAFGALPDRPAGDGFQTDPDPGGLRVAARGAGGAWLELEVERSDGSEAGHAAIGEGITFLGFGADRAAIHELRKNLRSTYHEARWAEFRAVEQALLTDAGVEDLLRDHPDLAKGDAARAAFLQQAQAWRPSLTAHQPPGSWKEAEDAKDEHVSMRHRSGPPFGDHLEIGWEMADQRWLRAAWERGQLVKVSVGAQ